jgi:hypothetical protein
MSRRVSSSMLTNAMSNTLAGMVAEAGQAESPRLPGKDTGAQVTGVKLTRSDQLRRRASLLGSPQQQLAGKVGAAIPFAMPDVVAEEEEEGEASPKKAMAFDTSKKRPSLMGGVMPGLGELPLSALVPQHLQANFGTREANLKETQREERERRAASGSYGGAVEGVKMTKSENLRRRNSQAKMLDSTTMRGIVPNTVHGLAGFLPDKLAGRVKGRAEQVR